MPEYHSPHMTIEGQVATIRPVDPKTCTPEEAEAAAKIPGGSPENSIDTVHLGFVHRSSNCYAGGRSEGFGSNANAPGASALEGIVGEISCEDVGEMACSVNLQDYARRAMASSPTASTSTSAARTGL